MKTKMDMQTVVANLCEVLTGIDGAEVAHAYNRICSDRILYVGDNIFNKLSSQEDGAVTSNPVEPIMFQAVLDDIRDALLGGEGKNLAQVYNSICSDRIAYCGDSLFESVPTQYSIPVHVVHDHEGKPKFALKAKGFSITDPFESECGRFKVDPVANYGFSLDEANQLVDLNQRLALALEEVTHAVSRAYQVPFGVTEGDAAGMFFSDEKAAIPLYNVVIELICNEFGIYLE